MVVSCVLNYVVRGYKPLFNRHVLFVPCVALNSLLPHYLILTNRICLLFNMASRSGTRMVRGIISKKKPDIEQAAALQRAGQNAYKVGDFQGAIESFTQVRYRICFVATHTNHPYI